MDQIPPFAVTAQAQPRRDFRSRRQPLRARLMGVAKRMAIVGVALAVPALAAPDTIAALQRDAITAQAVKQMPFETPGLSFPGSAFYYLEDAPHMVDAEGWDKPIAVIGAPAFTPSSKLADLPLAAAPLRIAGSDRDHVRAQQCMAQAIYYEAASESDAGQRAVAQVVLNRVAHTAYPRSVCGVVYQGSERTTGCQFSFTCDGSLARQPSRSGWDRASRIAREALAGVAYAPVGTATHYHTLAINPYWASSLDTVSVIGAHKFYRWRGAAGRPSAFTASYAGAEPSAARARALTPNAPDPASAPVIAAASTETGPISHSAAQPKPSVAAVAEGTAPLASAPRSGNIRSEYANSGRWIERP
ncbi:hypothetical protein CP97_07320 [Aurantiacibacter atlanticus]|uniref:Cell wall hydrolase SleB domain-containing protein n=1 Tax=Aurantiacibacter atlanticus TaxID=1648404 RepID=A0A0H4VEZ5_9SPHN|nr:cell wall hydrolase [Aurantiacibacter atlanticus]AKQ43257.2 hypothetical protein CP97_07320 [Aurantiacibacter atlanticus]MDF1834023.1 cell wall hydrolase [Alteraurantiacibacter sp. bin_em_oilr2.035]